MDASSQEILPAAADRSASRNSSSSARARSPLLSPVLSEEQLLARRAREMEMMEFRSTDPPPPPSPVKKLTLSRHSSSSSSLASPTAQIHSWSTIRSDPATAQYHPGSTPPTSSGIDWRTVLPAHLASPTALSDDGPPLSARPRAALPHDPRGLYPWTGGEPEEPPSWRWVGHRVEKWEQRRKRKVEALSRDEDGYLLLPVDGAADSKRRRVAAYRRQLDVSLHRVEEGGNIGCYIGGCNRDQTRAQSLNRGERTPIIPIYEVTRYGDPEEIKREEERIARYCPQYFPPPLPESDEDDIIECPPPQDVPAEKEQETVPQQVPSRSELVEAAARDEMDEWLSYYAAQDAGFADDAVDAAGTPPADPHAAKEEREDNADEDVIAAAVEDDGMDMSPQDVPMESKTGENNKDNFEQPPVDPVENADELKEWFVASFAPANETAQDDRVVDDVATPQHVDDAIEEIETTPQDVVPMEVLEFSNDLQQMPFVPVDHGGGMEEWFVNPFDPAGETAQDARTADVASELITAPQADPWALDDNVQPVLGGGLWEEPMEQLALPADHLLEIGAWDAANSPCAPSVVGDVELKGPSEPRGDQLSNPSVASFPSKSSEPEKLSGFCGRCGSDDVRPGPNEDQMPWCWWCDYTREGYSTAGDTWVVAQRIADQPAESEEPSDVVIECEVPADMVDSQMVPYSPLYAHVPLDHNYFSSDPSKPAARETKLFPVIKPLENDPKFADLFEKPPSPPPPKIVRMARFVISRPLNDAPQPPRSNYVPMHFRPTAHSQRFGRLRWPRPPRRVPPPVPILVDSIPEIGGRLLAARLQEKAGLIMGQGVVNVRHPSGRQIHAVWRHVLKDPLPAVLQVQRRLAAETKLFPPRT